MAGIDGMTFHLWNLAMEQVAVRFQSFNHLPTYACWINMMDPTYHALNYAHSGRLRWVDGNGDSVELEGPVAWWTWPGMRFRYGVQPGEAGWDHRYVTFSGSWVEDLRRLAWFPPCDERAFCVITSPQSFRRRMDALLEHLDTRRWAPAWQELFGLLLTAREERAQELPPLPHVGPIREVIAAIRSDPSAGWHDAVEAKRCGLSISHFRRLFRAEAGASFWRFCLEERLALAASLLRRTVRPVKEVAERCGLPDLAHFSKTFRAHYGVPPAEYRRRMRLIGP